jgi:alkylated DNA repair dioxygenase AlkB
MENNPLKDKGLSLSLDFITSDEERIILSKIKKFPLRRGEVRNSVQRFGLAKPYENGDLVENYIPNFLQEIIDKINSPIQITSVSINEYFIGQGILPHIDNAPSGEIIFILSLMNDAEMVFECQKNRKEKYTIQLPKGSLLEMKGEARHQWLHSIDFVTKPRYSIIFRTGPIDLK